MMEEENQVPIKIEKVRKWSSLAKAFNNSLIYILLIKKNCSSQMTKKLYALKDLPLTFYIFIG